MVYTPTVIAPVSSQFLLSKLRALGAWTRTRHKNSAQNIDLEGIRKEIRTYIKICILFLRSYILLHPQQLEELRWYKLDYAYLCTHTQTHTHSSSPYKRKLICWIWLISLNMMISSFIHFSGKISLFYFSTLLCIFITFSFFIHSLIDIEPSWPLWMNTDVQLSLYCWLRVPWVHTQYWCMW